DTKEALSEDMATLAKSDGVFGANEAYRVRIEGNGRGILKPPVEHREHTFGDLYQVPSGSHHKSEAAAYSFYRANGLEDHVPPTVVRDHEGSEMSLQQWSEDFSPLGHELRETLGGGNVYKNLLSLAPTDKRDALKNKVDETMLVDLVSNQGDGHIDNWLVSEDFSDVRKIDNGASFGNGMYGSKNEMFQAAAKRGKVTIPDHLQERWRTTSLGDLKRSLGDHLEDWQIGQQFLRQQYLLHLQDTEGHLDPERFRSSWGTGEGASPRMVKTQEGMSRYVGWDDIGGLAGFNARSVKNQLPHQLFDSFAKSWITEASTDENHPHHAVAKELDDLGVFMPPSAMADPREARRSGAHKEYEKSIVASKEKPAAWASKPTREQQLAEYGRQLKERKSAEDKLATGRVKKGDLHGREE
ncbi:MAG: hypothetical protein ACXABY_27570, partial [Candidatus Thorarchaeota archaeon]